MEKVQVKVYLSPKVAEALRIAAAKRGGQGAMSAVAEEIFRKALGVEEEDEGMKGMVYQAWLGDMLLGEGATREQAIEAAVREYEAQGGYGEYPLLRSREELISRLDVSTCPSASVTIRATPERSGSSMTYAEAVQQLGREGYTDIDYGDGWVDILDHLNSLEAAAYETQVVLQTGYDEDGTVRIVALDANGYLQSEPLARARRAE